MALDSTLVRVAVSGAVSVAPAATAAPADSSTALIAAYKDLGYISAKGVTEGRKRSTNDIKAWQGGAVVRTVVTDGTLTFNFQLIETNQRTVELFYGATVATTSIVIVPTSTGGRKTFVLDVVDGAQLCRVFVPQGEITEVGDLVYAGGEPVGYEVTLTAYPDATLGGSAKKFYSALAA
jgi:hypothetical protein